MTFTKEQRDQIQKASLEGARKANAESASAFFWALLIVPVLVTAFLFAVGVYVYHFGAEGLFSIHLNVFLGVGYVIVFVVAVVVGCSALAVLIRLVRAVANGNHRATLSQAVAATVFSLLAGLAWQVWQHMALPSTLQDTMMIIIPACLLALLCSHVPRMAAEIISADKT